MPRKFDLQNGKQISKYNTRQINAVSFEIKAVVSSSWYLIFPMYASVDLDILSAFIDIIYSVHVARQILFADKRNLPFSTSTAVKKK